MNRQTPKSLHKHYNFLLVIVSPTSNGCYDIAQSLLHRDKRKNSERRSQGWNTIFELQKPCFVLAEVQSERQRHRLESIYAQRDRERESSWLFDLITYKTRQPINNVFDKSAIMFAIYDQKKSRKKCSLDIYIYIEKRVNLPSCEFDAICKTSQP